MLLLSKLSQHFIELGLIKSCWSCKYKLLIGRLEGIGEWDQFWHLIIWHCSPQISEREITPELWLTNTRRQTVSLETLLNSRKLKSIQRVWRPERYWGLTRERARGIFPPCYYDEFESHSPEWNMILVVVPVIPYICLCSQSGRNWKNKSKNFEYLDPVYELIDAKKIFLATTSPSVRTETEIGIRCD